MAACSDGNTVGKPPNKPIEVSVGENVFSIPSNYARQVKSKAKGEVASRDSRGFFTTSLCLPDLRPLPPDDCDRSLGWGNVIDVLVQEQSDRPYAQFYKESVEPRIKKNCLVSLGAASFSSKYAHYVSKSCGSENNSNKREWKDLYLVSNPINDLFFTMTCKRPRENYYPSCRVTHAEKGFSIQYYFDRKHLNAFIEIHSGIVELISGFRTSSKAEV